MASWGFHLAAPFTSYVPPLEVGDPKSYLEGLEDSWNKMRKCLVCGQHMVVLFPLPSFSHLKEDHVTAHLSLCFLICFLICFHITVPTSAVSSHHKVQGILWMCFRHGGPWHKWIVFGTVPWECVPVERQGSPVVYS